MKDLETNKNNKKLILSANNKPDPKDNSANKKNNPLQNSTNPLKN